MSRAALPETMVRAICPCRPPNRGYTIAHYDRIICACGKTYWALQPKRNGGLVMFPWPGHNLTREQMAEI